MGFEPSTFVPLLCRKDPQPFQRTETRSSLKQRNSSVKDLVKKLESATSGKSETNLKAAASFDKRKSISAASLTLRSAAAAAAVMPPTEAQLPELPPPPPPTRTASSPPAPASKETFPFPDFDDTKDSDQVP